MTLDRRIALGAGLTALAVLGWLCTATVENGSRGVVERFGAASRELSPGIHLRLPWPVEIVRKAEVDRSLQMPIGYRLVDELRSIEPTPREKQWLTADTNIVELKATVLYRVFDVRAWLYGVSGVGASGSSERESSRFALRRLGEAALTDIVAGLTIDQVLTAGLAVVPSEARERIQRDADRLGLGVMIDEVQLLESKPPVGVRRAFTDVQDALADKERSISQAQFAANRLEVATPHAGWPDAPGSALQRRGPRPPRPAVEPAPSRTSPPPWETPTPTQLASCTWMRFNGSSTGPSCAP